YKFSEKYSKRTPCSKYTEKLFIGCMLYIIMNNRSWTLFIGPINGKQVHKKFRDYCNNQLFKYLFTDTSFIFAQFANAHTIKNNPNEFYFLADKGYDTKAIISTLKNNKLKPIIPYNKKNTKDSTKIRTYTDEELEIYKNRIKVENFFTNIKKYPKINHVYEK